MWMNIDVLYLLGVVAIVVALTFGIGYMRIRNPKLSDIISDDLLKVMLWFDLCAEIVDDLGLLKEKQVKQIRQIIYDAIEYVVANFQDSENIPQEYAYKYVVNLCLTLGIELTNQRKEIIKKLIIIGLNNRYSKEN